MLERFRHTANTEVSSLWFAKATFVTVASHDTASAIIGTPGEGSDWGYISSGTWSLLGIETKVPNVSLAAFNENYTNEWGAHNDSLLKTSWACGWSKKWLGSKIINIPMQNWRNWRKQHLLFNSLSMSMILVESRKHDYWTASVLSRNPAESSRNRRGTGSLCDDNLALCYASELQSWNSWQVRRASCKTAYRGGGSNNRFLNQLTADAAQLTIEAGPSEATAIGNLFNADDECWHLHVAGWSTPCGQTLHFLAVFMNHSLWSQDFKPTINVL